MSTEVLSKPPEIVMMSVDELVVPAWNPRKFKDEGEMADLMAYLKKGGYVPRIFVWGADQKSVISGQRRLLAYRRLGKTQIEAEILDITLEEAQVLAISSNEGAEVYWLDKYESWEPFIHGRQGISLEAVGDKLGVSKAWVIRADSLLKVLNGTVRQMIHQSLPGQGIQGDAENKGNKAVGQSLTNDTETLKKRTPGEAKKWQLTEVVAFRLTALRDKRTLEEAQALVEKALPVILARQMTGPQVDELVVHILSGGDIALFQPAPKAKRGKASDGSPEKTPKPSPLTGEGGPAVSDQRELKPVRGGKAVQDEVLGVKSEKPEIPTPQPTPIGTGARNDNKGSQTDAPYLHAQIASWVAGGELAKMLHLPAGYVARLFPSFTRLFQRVIGLFQWLGVKNKVAATILALFLILTVGSSLISRANRFLEWMVSSRALFGNKVSQPAPAPRLQGEGQALGVPIPKEGIGAPVTAGPAPNPSSPASAQSQLPQATAQSAVTVQSASQAMSPQDSAGNKPKEAQEPPANASVSQKDSTEKKSGDPLKSVGDAVKDVSNTVNTAGQGLSAADQAKKLLGF